jgi:hypothetical protein
MVQIWSLLIWRTILGAILKSETLLTRPPERLMAEQVNIPLRVDV